MSTRSGEFGCYVRCRGRGDEEEHERDAQARARVRVAGARAAAEAAAGDEQPNAEHDEPDSRRREHRRRGEADGLEDRRSRAGAAGTNSEIEDHNNG
jgi:hypothetical protein